MYHLIRKEQGFLQDSFIAVNRDDDKQEIVKNVIFIPIDGFSSFIGLLGKTAKYLPIRAYNE